MCYTLVRHVSAKRSEHCSIPFFHKGLNCSGTFLLHKVSWYNSPCNPFIYLWGTQRREFQPKCTHVIVEFEILYYNFDAGTLRTWSTSHRWPPIYLVHPVPTEELPLLLTHSVDICCAHAAARGPWKIQVELMLYHESLANVSWNFDLDRDGF